MYDNDKLLINNQFVSNKNEFKVKNIYSEY